MSLQEQNALWQLFSGNAQGFEYGDAHYKWYSPEDKSLLNQLYKLYLKEGVDMPYTFEDFFSFPNSVWECLPRRSASNSL